jgi:hypothetical protein
VSDVSSLTRLSLLRNNYKALEKPAKISLFFKKKILKNVTLKIRRGKLKKLIKVFRKKKILNIEKGDSSSVSEDFQLKLNYLNNKKKLNIPNNISKLRELYNPHFLTLLINNSKNFSNFSKISYFNKIINHFIIVSSARYKLNYLKSISNLDQLLWLVNFKKSSTSLAHNNFFLMNRSDIFLKSKKLGGISNYQLKNDYDKTDQTFLKESLTRLKNSSFRTKKALNSFIRYYSTFRISKGLNLNPIRRPLFSMFFDFNTTKNTYFFRSYFSEKINLR